MALVPSVRYAGQVDADANYPQGKARNAGTFQDGTGTPLEKDWVNDLWGFEQALLAEGGITPSGNADQVGASDYLAALKVVCANTAKSSIDSQALALKQISIERPFTDTGAAMAVARPTSGTTSGAIVPIKAGAGDVHRMSEYDDMADALGAVTSITSLVTDAAVNGARIVAVGTGGNRCAFSSNGGFSWSAGADLGATPERLIYNAPKTRFMATYAAGVNVAQSSDASVPWASVSSGLTSGQGGIAHFSNGDTVVCGLDGSSAVQMRKSTDGGASWGATATVPSPSGYADSGQIVGNGGTNIYHVGRDSGATLFICRTTSAMSWSLIATVVSLGIISSKPRILLCPDTGVLALLWTTSGGTQCKVSRDGGVTWSVQAFYRFRALASFGIARGRLYATNNGCLYATDFLN